MIAFWKKLKLWQKFTLSSFLFGLLCVIVVPIIFCDNVDLDLSKQQRYTSCIKDSDCISKSCGCLNSSGARKFSFLTNFCRMQLDCLPPSECKCQEEKCIGSFDDHILLNND